MGLFKMFRRAPSTTLCNHEYITESVAIRQGNDDFKTVDVIIIERCAKCDHVKQTIHADMVRTSSNLFYPLDEHLLIADKNITHSDVELLLATKSSPEFDWLSRHLGIHPEGNTFESGIGASMKNLFNEHRAYLKKHEPSLKRSD